MGPGGFCQTVATQSRFDYKLNQVPSWLILIRITLFTGLVKVVCNQCLQTIGMEKQPSPMKTSTPKPILDLDGRYRLLLR